MHTAFDPPACRRARLPVRRCPACFAPVGLLAVRCGACAYPLNGRYGGGETGGLAMGTVLAGRYVVGRCLQSMDGERVYAGFDRRTKRIVRLTAAAAEERERTDLLCRARALLRLAGCQAIAAPDEVWLERNWLFAVSSAPDKPFCDGGRSIGDAEMRRCLARLTDALLVIHSLGAQPDGDAVHGAPCLESLLLAEDGALRLALPLLPRTGEPADDIRGFGSVLLPLGTALSPAVEAILRRRCAGGYASVLEIKHELNCL